MLNTERFNFTIWLQNDTKTLHIQKTNVKYTSNLCWNLYIFNYHEMKTYSSHEIFLRKISCSFLFALWYWHEKEWIRIMKRYVFTQSISSLFDWPEFSSEIDWHISLILFICIIRVSLRIPKTMRNPMYSPFIRNTNAKWEEGTHHVVQIPWIYVICSSQ